MKLLPLLCLVSVAAVAQDEGPGQRPSGDPINAQTFSSLRARLIGPAVISGRVAQIAMFPDSTSHYLVGVASGNIFATTNNGNSWTPVFDNYGSYSIGWIEIDQKNPSIVWVGTGENNNQRSVSYGDGVYKSEDGGRTFRNVGLKKTEHVARIVIDPRDSNVVYVAAPGPLWKGGGERGLYKTTDGGKTWSQSLIKVGEYTGCSDVIMDPKNPDILLAATHQRQRRFFGMIHGGPESALWRSVDAGKTWTQARGGFPQGELGRIGMNYAPATPGMIYAQVEGPEGRGGLYRSSDNGVTWEKRNSVDQQGQYYSKVQVDPHDSNRVYIQGVSIMVSDDGGRTQSALPSRGKHVDNHDIWIDPKNPNHYLVGCDGGLYETYDRAANWIYKANLPTGQFYDIAVDENAPFYYVYGGTQDNNSLGCPGRNKNADLVNADCFITNGGDGFYTKVDPKDPNTVYSSSQNGGLVRYDRRTGESLSIAPEAAKDDPALRWNWDTPLMISPHSNTRLYYGAQMLYRSDDRGDSWKPVSKDLTRSLDRNTLPLMGKVWTIDAIQKNVSTALYGNISSMTESPKQEGLIYVGTDDGLVQVTEDGGKTWRKVEKPGGAPEDGYVQRMLASQHDVGTVYAVYDNHQNGDFKPYIVKSTDKGRTWVNVAGNLPETGSVYALAEDHVNKNLLFAGTEFGLYFSNSGGEKWLKLSIGLPTIQVRDLVIQKQMNDLVIGTFGRSIYILDDYTPIREATPELMTKDSAVFPVRTALSYIPANRSRGNMASEMYTAQNPPVGALITVNLKEAPRTKRQERQQKERAATQRGETPPYPTPEVLRAESEEEAPALIVNITDASGKVVRRMESAATRGVRRITWDLRLQSATSAGGARGGTGAGAGAAGGGRGGAGGGGGGGEEEVPAAFAGRGGGGSLALPGKYTVSLALRQEAVYKPLAGSQSFEVVAEGPATKEDRATMSEFQDKLAKLQKAMTATTQSLTEARTRIEAIQRAIDATLSMPAKAREDAAKVVKELAAIDLAMNGDRIWRARNEGTPASISEHFQAAQGPSRGTGRPTKTALEQYQIASDGLAVEIPKLRKIVETDLKNLEKQLDAAGAPPTPGRPLPDWKAK
jgi:photosystem II stability/assembly factor-like uncharacterized protein